MGRLTVAGLTYEGEFHLMKWRGVIMFMVSVVHIRTISYFAHSIHASDTVISPREGCRGACCAWSKRYESPGTMVMMESEFI